MEEEEDQGKAVPQVLGHRALVIDKGSHELCREGQSPCVWEQGDTIVPKVARPEDPLCRPSCPLGAMLGYQEMTAVVT